MGEESPKKVFDSILQGLTEETPTTPALSQDFSSCLFDQKDESGLFSRMQSDPDFFAALDDAMRLLEEEKARLDPFSDCL